MDDALTQQEVDQLRDSAFVPVERIKVFERILDDRNRMLKDLLVKRAGHTDFGNDMHDVVDQIGLIDDELNDNLDEYSSHHRDVRRVLPKLGQAVDDWRATLQNLPANDDYAIVRRTALDNLRDTHDLVHSLGTELDAYFKAHPEALKEEKRRADNPNAVRDPEQP